MNLFSKITFITGILAFGTIPFTPMYASAIAADSAHEEKAGGDEHVGEEKDHEEEGVVKLTALQLSTAGIVTQALLQQQLSSEVRAPGEVKLNAYATVHISPRITAQVVGRVVRLGDHVTKGQPLLALSSVEMAEAQSALLLAEREWSRVRKLGRKVVSDRRYTEANVKRQTAYAKVQAYGMTRQQADKLLKSSADSADGTFQLLATRDGTVISDNFIEGQVVAPGQILFTLTDESILWVESSLTPQQATIISSGARARVKSDKQWLNATVTQLHHMLNEKTRTLAIRLEVPNKDDQLHPGQFVDAFIQTNQSGLFLAVPESAVLRSPDGDWQIMVEQDEPGEFKGVEVELVRVTNGMAVIEGVKPGIRVVTKGAFFVQSELAKSGFDIHNH